MSMLTIEAAFPDIGRVIAAVERMKNGQMTYTREAVQAATIDVVQRTWIQYAQGVQVTYSGGTFRVNSVTGAYARSIEDGVRYPDDLTGEVFTSHPHGKLIEEGIDPFDQKKGLLNSPKAKRGKNGNRYITVPFRHGVPGTVGLPSMPPNVYDQARRLSYSRRVSVLGFTFHKWGGRLGESPQGQRSQIGGARQDATGRGYTWKTGMFSGMVRAGRPGHTQYLTFRRVSDNSDPRSWQHPGTEPRPIRQAVVENTRDEVLRLVRSGFEMDLYFLGLGER